MWEDRVGGKKKYGRQEERVEWIVRRGRKNV